jgi:glycosyltransferase involved in cell wall biosynthesis
MTNISVIIPAKNEEETLPMVLRDLYQTIPQLTGYRVEVICVDDHSTDRTAEVARSFGTRVVQNTEKSGKGMALRAGFQGALGEIFVMMDADYSHRAEDLPVFLQAFKDGVGLVIGSRVVGGSEEYTHVRALGNVFLSTTVGLCLGRYLSDALNGYKVFRRDIFTDFKYTSRNFEIEIEIIANTLRKGYRIVEVSSHERSRAGGEMKSRVIRHGTGFLLRIFEERFRGIQPKHVPSTKVGAPASRSATSRLSNLSAK